MSALAALGGLFMAGFGMFLLADLIVEAFMAVAAVFAFAMIVFFIFK